MTLTKRLILILLLFILSPALATPTSLTKLAASGDFDAAGTLATKIAEVSSFTLPTGLKNVPKVFSRQKEKDLFALSSANAFAGVLRSEVVSA